MAGKHTPGPWELQMSGDGTCELVVVNHDTGLVREIAHNLWVDSDEGLANAALLSAAPKLLEALQVLLAAATTSATHGLPFAINSPGIVAARTAITHATGERE